MITVVETVSLAVKLCVIMVQVTIFMVNRG